MDFITGNPHSVIRCTLTIDQYQIEPGCDCCAFNSSLVEDKFTWTEGNTTYGRDKSVYKFNISTFNSLECCRGDIVIKLDPENPEEPTTTEEPTTPEKPSTREEPPTTPTEPTTPEEPTPSEVPTTTTTTTTTSDTSSYSLKFCG